MNRRGARPCTRRAGALTLLGTLALFACDGQRGRDKAVIDAATPGPGASPSIHAAASAVPRPSLPPAAPRAAGVPCKIMSAEGGPAATADPTRWIELPARASFTVRTLETGRELRFEGPGRVRACGDDIPLVAEGAAVGLPGAGEGPGAEQWAATACGVVRWAGGVHRFAGGRDTCVLQSSVGVAQLWLADDVRLEDLPIDGGAPADRDAAAQPSPWHRIVARRAVRLHGRAPLDAAGAVKSALASCERAATEVESLGTRMMASDASSGALGELAARSVGSRGAARAACAVAAVRVALAGSRSDEQARLDAAVSRWRAPR